MLLVRTSRFGLRCLGLFLTNLISFLSRNLCLSPSRACDFHGPSLWCMELNRMEVYSRCLLPANQNAVSTLFLLGVCDRIGVCAPFSAVMIFSDNRFEQLREFCSDSSTKEHIRR